ncbi:polysaccharide deacetylase family protein [Paenibacillus sp.]|jgi:peptidoglycan/xylan/chitin deacetylase (PgdA/CDA1 family)|uniref:polysaccharide deacetylase family protein n=1 Tax=Paenibacillus sp. TaxID=58172 RepID=UPI002828C1D9|nr:polysaccharide deacetylase family protein [Paenibacillus sp.]MDR0268042.1 polysaccharide deacetylase family protein [Paenibacillus sp.]
MKTIWIVPLFALLVCSGCNQYKTNQTTPQVTPKGIKYNSTKITQTPDLLEGPERAIRNPHPLSLADLRTKYKSTFLLSGPSSKREVALTFDDAPDDKFTPQVLDVLKSEGVKATFFLVGNRIEAHPEIVQRMVNEGHVVGNHSYNHANLPKLSDANFRKQVNKTDNIIRSISGYTPKIIRPPYGNISEPQIQWLASQHKKIVNWNVDSLDWKGLNAEQVKTNVLAQVHPGSIILQHAAGGTGEDLSGSVQALSDIIKKLRKDKVKLVTIPELLDLPEGIHEHEKIQ